ncbi:sialic acid-binding Ig-like lectin 14 [Podarcis muralis]
MTDTQPCHLLRPALLPMHLIGFAHFMVYFKSEEFENLEMMSPEYKWKEELQCLRSQLPGYDLKALEAVTVQRGLCVHIPCNFTYPTSQYSGELYVYWIKNDRARSTQVHYTRNYFAGIIVASNDKDQSIASFAGNRFQLTGNPSEGDCSFSINDVKFEDEGQYYFRIEKGQILRFSYRFSLILPHVSVTGKRFPVSLFASWEHCFVLFRAVKGGKALPTNMP